MKSWLVRSSFWLCLGLTACPQEDKAETEDDAAEDDADERKKKNKKKKKAKKKPRPKKRPAGPVVEIRGTNILVDGTQADTTKMVEHTGTLKKVDGVWDALSNKRKAFKAANPDKPFAGHVRLNADDGTKMLAFKSVFQTSAYAGYSSISIDTPPRFVLVQAVIPGPPDPDAPAGSPKELHVHVLPTETKLVWKHGREVLDEVTGGVASEGTAKSLTQDIVQGFSKHGLGKSKLTEVVVAPDSELTFGILKVALGAIDAARTELQGEEDAEPFTISFSVTGQSQAASRIKPPWETPSEPSASPSAASSAPKASASSGRLKPEVIQKEVRSHFDEFRACYQNGLMTNPNLKGRISIRFVIAVDGTVSNITTSGSLPDPVVERCVANAFWGIRFPKPDGGIVTVSYPIVFTPSG